MRRPSYAVVSYSLLVLALFGLLVESLRSKIPLPPPNRLQFEASEYLVQGSRSEVDWRPLEASAFAEARRTGRPILLLIGTPWSKSAREADAQIFTDRDVVSFLNRYMVCIRIDAETEPKWLTALLPIRRVALPMLTGFQVWFLTPEGQLFDNGAEMGTPQVPFDPDSFGDILVRVRERLRETRAGGTSTPVPGTEQSADKAILTQPTTNSRTNLVEYDAEVQRQIDGQWGGFMRLGKVRPAPELMYGLLLRGSYDGFRKLADALLSGPLVDWLDGGFYRSYFASAPPSLEFDKLAVANSELMTVFAKAGAILKNPLYRSAAERCFDCLVGSFVQNGIVAGCQIGDEGPQGRSSRNSFSPKQLRELLTPEEREVAREDLGLRVEANRFMAVRMRRPDLAFMEESAACRVLQILRQGRRTAASFAGKRQLDIHAYVVARLLECARLWGDSKRLMAADELFGRLDWFVAGDDLRHTLESGVPDEPYLGDYLAYADAALQSYLAFGRPGVLQHGLQVLRRARFLFETGTPGVWQMAFAPKESLGPRDVDVPEILDLARESCMAQAIRLCSSYGRLFRDAELLQAGQSAMGQFSGLVDDVGVQGAGLVCSFATVQDDTYIAVSGPGAVSTANEIFRSVPTRLVAPAMGPLAGRFGDGIFFVKAGVANRKSSAGDAVKGLSPILVLPH